MRNRLLAILTALVLLALVVMPASAALGIIFPETTNSTPPSISAQTNP